MHGKKLLSRGTEKIGRVLPCRKGIRISLEKAWKRENSVKQEQGSSQGMSVLAYSKLLTFYLSLLCLVSLWRTHCPKLSVYLETTLKLFPPVWSRAMLPQFSFTVKLMNGCMNSCHGAADIHPPSLLLVCPHLDKQAICVQCDWLGCDYIPKINGSKTFQSGVVPWDRWSGIVNASVQPGCLSQAFCCPATIFQGSGPNLQLFYTDYSEALSVDMT